MTFPRASAQLRDQNGRFVKKSKAGVPEDVGQPKFRDNSLRDDEQFGRAAQNDGAPVTVLAIDHTRKSIDNNGSISRTTAMQPPTASPQNTAVVPPPISTQVLLSYATLEHVSRHAEKLKKLKAPQNDMIVLSYPFIARAFGELERLGVFNLHDLEHSEPFTTSFTPTTRTFAAQGAHHIFSRAIFDYFYHSLDIIPNRTRSITMEVFKDEFCSSMEKAMETWAKAYPPFPNEDDENMELENGIKSAPSSKVAQEVKEYLYGFLEALRQLIAWWRDGGQHITEKEIATRNQNAQEKKWRTDAWIQDDNLPLGGERRNIWELSSEDLNGLMEEQQETWSEESDISEHRRKLLESASST
ncbi:hypothetical protein K504DRAFT_456160 [Pleomassaria siparia CBS 279.74]|uniref:Uncharacterized protein n=1 Tax=Pleomassaria siparia CBS 279.74 TaxID=1314801 RepID=A0A6G1K5F2_9PLEO|nr:hypothetical protein K504DRAFT_456160 [Pleomassaria siparia CBS 279.74]